MGIGLAAFANNQIYNITIPDSVIIIWHNAFLNNKLSSVFIPNAEAYVSPSAFDIDVTITIGAD